MKKIITIKGVSITKDGITYKLLNTSFPERYISHEMIIEMFYKHRGYQVEAQNRICIDETKPKAGEQMNHITHFDSCGCEKDKAKSEVFDAVLARLKRHREDHGNIATYGYEMADWLESHRSSILGTDEGEK